MVRKYLVDSCVYWAKEYHIDGFRFDLMALHDVETMNAIRAALDALPGGEDILMYGILRVHLIFHIRKAKPVHILHISIVYLLKSRFLIDVV